MTDRRSFFKSLAMLGAAAVGCPGIFIPKFEPVRSKRSMPVPYDYFALQHYFIDHPPIFDPAILITDAETVYAIKPIQVEFVTHTFHCRES